MSKWTEGPWHCDKKGQIWRRPIKDLYQYGGGVAGDYPLAFVSGGGPDWEDGFPREVNARLIAKAPEMAGLLMELSSIPIDTDSSNPRAEMIKGFLIASGIADKARALLAELEDEQ